MKYMLWLAAVLGFAGNAFAGGTINPAGFSAWDVFAFGNGEVIAATLTAVTLMVQDPVYVALIHFAALLGFVALVIKAGIISVGQSGGSVALNLGASVILRFIVILLVIDLTVGLAGPPLQADVLVTDVVSGQTTMVQNVPAAVAIPATLLSTASQVVTEAIERNFALPGVAFPAEMKMANGAPFMLASSLVQGGTKIQINDPHLRQSMAAYSTDCVVPLIASGQINTAALIHSPDVWGAIKNTSPAVHTIHYTTANPSGAVVSCNTAYTNISASLNAAVPTMLQEASGSMQSGPALAVLGNAMNSALFWMMNGQPGGLDAAGYIKQGAVINMMKDANATVAASSNNNELLLTMALEQAKQSQVTSWYTSAEIFKSTMGYIYSVLQAFVIAISPIVLAMILFGVTKLLGGYIMILLWLALWTPLLAVVNFIMTAYAQADLSSMMLHGGNITIGSMPAVSEKTSKMMAAAGYLATLIPVFSYGLIRGTLAFTEFVSQGMGSAFASSAGSQAATGSASWGNQSLDNMNMNKQSFSMKTDGGFAQSDVMNGLGAVQLSNQLGGMSHTAHGARVGDVKTGTSEKTTASERAELGQKVEEANSMVRQTGEILAHSAGKAVNTLFGLDKTTAEGQSAGTDTAYRTEAATQLAASVKKAVSGKISGTDAIEQEVNGIVQAAIRASGGDLNKAAAGMKVLAAASGGNALLAAAANMLSGNASVNVKMSAETKNMIEQAQQDTKESGQTSTNTVSGSKGGSAGQTVSSTDTAKTSRSASENETYQRTIQDLQSAINAHSAATTAQRSAVEAYERSQTVSADFLYVMDPDQVKSGLAAAAAIAVARGGGLLPDSPVGNGTTAAVDAALAASRTSATVAAAHGTVATLLEAADNDVNRQFDTLRNKTTAEQKQDDEVLRDRTRMVERVSSENSAAANENRDSIHELVLRQGADIQNRYNPQGNLIPTNTQGGKGNEHVGLGLASVFGISALSMGAGVLDSLGGFGGGRTAGTPGTGAPDGSLDKAGAAGLGARALMFTGAVGAAGLAAWAGWEAGRALDERFGLGEKFANTSVGESVFSSVYKAETAVREWWRN